MLEAIRGSFDCQEEEGGKEESGAGHCQHNKEEREEQKVEFGWGSLEKEKSRYLVHLRISVNQDKSSHSLGEIGTNINHILNTEENLGWGLYLQACYDEK